MRLSIGDALRHVLDTQPKTELAQNVKEHLTQGLTAPDELAVQALDVALLGSHCQKYGWILDGYPSSRKQVDLMTERSIIPVKVLELKIESREVMARGGRDRSSSSRFVRLP